MATADSDEFRGYGVPRVSESTFTKFSHYTKKEYHYYIIITAGRKEGKEHECVLCL